MTPTILAAVPARPTDREAGGALRLAGARQVEADLRVNIGQATCTSAQCIPNDAFIGRSYSSRVNASRIRTLTEKLFPEGEWDYAWELVRGTPPGEFICDLLPAPISA